MTVKKSFLFILSVLGYLSSAAQNVRRLYVGDLMSGKVRQMIETSFEVTRKNNGTVKTQPLSRMTFFYDAQGNTTVVLNYQYKAKDGEKLFVLFQKHSFKYYKDETGSRLVDAYRDSIKTSTPKIDAEGKTISVDYFDPKGNISNKAVYNHTSDSTTNSLFDAKRKLVRMVTYQYNINGDISVLTSYDEKNKSYFQYHYQYLNLDTKGNWTKSTSQMIKGRKIKEFEDERIYSYYP